MSRITEAARGEPCLVRIPGVCTHRPETSIWSHYRGQAGGKGIGIKSIDLCGAICCTACDACYDQGLRRPPEFSKADVDLMWLQGHIRSLVRLHELGIIR